MIRSLAKFAVESTGLHHPYRWIRRQRPPVLMYHGITENEAMTDWTQVHAGAFESQLRFLKKRYRVRPLAEVVEMIVSNRVEPFTAAVTFDDGYRSVHRLALPLLERYEIPATVFIASDFLVEREGTPSFMWPDWIMVLFLAAGTIGNTSGSGTSAVVDLGDLDVGSYDVSSPALARASARRLVAALKVSPDTVRRRVVDTLRNRYESQVPAGEYEDYHPMTWEEARRLSGHPLITIGGHTKTHPILSRAEPERQREEMVEGKERLERELGVTVHEFAYPNGQRTDFDDATVHIARETFRFAVTTEEGQWAVGDNLFTLRRLGIGSDVSLSRFKALVAGIYTP